MRHSITNVDVRSKHGLVGALFVAGLLSCGGTTPVEAPFVPQPKSTPPVDEPPPPRVEPASDAIEAAPRLDVQGHRGARGLRPESTLPSLEAALDLGVDTLELDLHLTKDDQLVVWHDPVVDKSKCRKGGGELDPDGSKPLAVRQLDAAALASLTCDRNPDPDRFPRQSASPGVLAGSRYHIATLNEVFDFVETYGASEDKTERQRTNARTVRFNIELKRKKDDPSTIDDGFDGTEPREFEKALVELIQRRELKDRVTIQSFDHRSLWAVRQLDETLALAALTHDGETPSFKALWRRGASVWSPNQRQVTAETLAAAHDAGLRVVPWTINDKAEMTRLIDLGVDGIITDVPDILVHSAPRSSDEQLLSVSPLPQKPPTFAAKVKGRFPGDYTTARAYTFNHEITGRPRCMTPLDTDGRLCPTTEGPIVELNDEDATSITKLLTNRKTYSRDGAKCFLPRHGIVYYDANDDPVAWVSICFMCNQLRTGPALGVVRPLGVEYPFSETGLEQLQLECERFGFPHCRDTRP